MNRVQDCVVDVSSGFSICFVADNLTRRKMAGIQL
nr:MAG TPA: hypothetical protein [Caudoviricetes sp.]